MSLARIATVVLVLAAGMFAQTNPVPFLNNPLVPASVAPGGQSFTLTVNGTGFVPGSVVNWNGRPLATTYLSTTRLSARVPAQAIANAGTASVAVVNLAATTSNVAFLPVANSRTRIALTRTFIPAVGNYPVAADLNRDGKQDLVINDYSTGSHVLLGNGGAMFRSVLNDSCGYGSLVVTDFNQDNVPDIASSHNGTLNVCLGLGGGTFAPPLTSQENFFPLVMVTADFNRDGTVDLLGDFGFSVALVLGNGDGTFEPVSLIGTTSGYYNGIAVGDFNRDGVLDFVAADSVGSDIAVFLGDSQGGFQTPLISPAGPVPEWPVVADFDGDGDLDIVIANSLTGTVSIFVGNGDGTFQPAVQWPSTPGPTQMVAADLNNDGHLDLAMTDDYDGYLSVMLGNGDGTFQSPNQFPTSNNPYFLTVGDFNSDGRLDLLAGSGDGDTLFFVLQSSGSKAVSGLDSKPPLIPSQVR